jgi:hypothetical protein
MNTIYEKQAFLLMAWNKSMTRAIVFFTNYPPVPLFNF